MLDPELRFGPFRLNRASQSLMRGNQDISLTPKAFAVLLHFADHAGRLVTKHELLDAVWRDTHVTDGALKRCVVEIRRALQDDAAEPRYIQTLHGRGYRFVCDNGDHPISLRAEPESAMVPVKRQVIVGRNRELGVLNRCLEQATHGVRQIVFIEGEAGLGKTTLVEHWLGAGARSWGLGRGRCLHQFGAGEPYLPVFEALGDLSRRGDLGSRLLSILRRCAPTWLLHMPSLVSGEDYARLRDASFGTGRDRMLREITDALEALSAESPILLVLEDLHWSDPSTIDVLLSIATRVSPARLMVISTYRPDEVRATCHPLNQVRQRLEMHDQCIVLPLEYLNEEEVGRYVAGRLSIADTYASLIKPLHRRTNGNPLFMSCIVGELARQDTIPLSPDFIHNIVPTTLQNLFEQQYERLTGVQRKLLDAASVEGELFSTASMAAVLRRDEADVEACCERLVQKQRFLKRAEPIRFPDGFESPRYQFLHILCRDALYRALPAVRRSRLHAEIARATAHLYVSDPHHVAAELARHFELGRDLHRAVEFLQLAADAAAARFANREAEAHLEHAIQLTETIGGACGSAVLMNLLERRGMIRMSTMDLPGSAADFAALGVRGALAGDVNRRVTALLDSVMPWAFLDYERAISAVDEALRLKSEADPVLAALVDVYQAGVQTYFHGWTSDLAKLMNAALERLTEVTEARMRFRFLWMQSFVRNGAADFSGSCRASAESRQLARNAGIYHPYFLATHNLIMGLIHRGDLGEAMRTARADAALAAMNHHALEQFWLESLEALVAIEANAFGTARVICERIVRQTPLMDFHLTPHAFLWLGLARLGESDLDGAQEAFERLASAIDRGGVGFEYRYPLLQGQALCALALGDLREARHLAVRSIELAQAHHAVSYEARGYRLLSDVATQEGDRPEAAKLASRAIAALGNCEALNVEWQVYATAARAWSAVGRNGESREARSRALQVGNRVAATLNDVPHVRDCMVACIQSQLE